MLDLVAFLVVLIVGCYFLALGVVSLASPAFASRFLMAIALASIALGSFILVAALAR